MLVYKYLPPERIDVLRFGRIRFTPPASLNDPFECSPQFDLSAPIGSLRRAAFEGIDRMLTQFVAEPGVSPEDRARARQLVDEKKAEMAAQTDTAQLSAACVETTRSLLSESVGILSLSKTPISTAMWAHYASNHSGYLLGFDTESEWFHLPDACGRRTPIWTVEYSDRPSIVPVAENGHLALSGDILYRAMIGRKLRAWEYEQEIRITRSFGVEHDCVGVDPLGNAVRLFYIEKEAIKRVVIGSCADRALVNEISSLLRAHGLETVELLRAQVSRQAHQLELVPCQ